MYHLRPLLTISFDFIDFQVQHVHFGGQPCLDGQRRKPSVVDWFVQKVWYSHVNAGYTYHFQYHIWDSYSYQHFFNSLDVWHTIPINQYIHTLLNHRNGQSVKMVRFAAMALCSLTMQDTVRSSMVRSGVAEPLCDLHSHLKHHSKDELTVKCKCSVACTCLLNF